MSLNNILQRNQYDLYCHDINVSGNINSDGDIDGNITFNGNVTFQGGIVDFSAANNLIFKTYQWVIRAIYVGDGIVPANIITDEIIINFTKIGNNVSAYMPSIYAYVPGAGIADNQPGYFFLPFLANIPGHDYEPLPNYLLPTGQPGSSVPIIDSNATASGYITTIKNLLPFDNRNGFYIFKSGGITSVTHPEYHNLYTGTFDTQQGAFVPEIQISLEPPPSTDYVFPFTYQSAI